MAYHKVNADQRAQGHSPYLDSDELQATALELEWDMEKELEEPGFDHFRLDSAAQHHLGNSQSPELDLEPIQPSSSPKGRFQRLQEDPDYVSHYTRQAPKSNRCSFLRLLKVFCTALILFIFGIVIGYYARKKCPSPPTPQEPNNPHIYHEILKEIKAENIRQIYRYVAWQVFLFKWSQVPLLSLHLIVLKCGILFTNPDLFFFMFSFILTLGRCSSAYTKFIL